MSPSVNQPPKWVVYTQQKQYTEMAMLMVWLLEPQHYRLFNSTPGLYQLDVSPRQVFPGGQNHPSWELRIWLNSLYPCVPHFVDYRDHLKNLKHRTRQNKTKITTVNRASPLTYTLRISKTGTLSPELFRSLPHDSYRHLGLVSIDSTEHGALTCNSPDE